jgi:starvation-inducible DNA-binding protein
MDELLTSMNKCLANTFVFYFKAHAFHWNVEGINFPTYHEFFGDLYEDLYSAVDPMAEEIRALGAYAPAGLNELYKNATIADNDIKGTNVKVMLEDSLVANTTVLECLNTSFAIATKENKQGLADFLAGRIDIHKKHEWMIRSCLKGA